MGPRKRSQWQSGGFWRAQRPAARARILGGVFFTFAVIGFVTDIWSLDPARPRALAIAAACYTGVIAMGYVLAFMSGRPARAAMVFAVQILGTFLLPKLIPASDNPAAALIESAALRRQLVFDGIGLLAAMGMGYGLFMSYIRGDGDRHIRLRTEVDLAKTIHDRLAPPIRARTRRLDVYGRAEPSSEIAGDLLDLIETAGGQVVYVADVTGHGIAAGTVASMVKSAVRMGLLRTPRLEAVLGDLNRVLRQLDRPELFVTCAGIAFDDGDGGTATVTMAGHPPVLIVPARDGGVRRVHNARPPLGILDVDELPAETVSCEPGDMFALFTDGLTEVANAAGEQLGDQEIERILRDHAGRPLDDIAAAVFDAARRHGPREDDQTLLLVRVLG